MSVQRCRCRRLSRWVVAAAAAVGEGKRNVPPHHFPEKHRPGHNFVIWCWSRSSPSTTERNLTRRDSHAPRRPDAALPRDASDGSASVDALYPRRRRGHERRRIPCHGARPLRVHVVCLSRSAVLLAPPAARPPAVLPTRHSAHADGPQLQAPRLAAPAAPLLARAAGFSTAPPAGQQQPGLTMEMALSISNATHMQLDKGLQGAHLDQIRVRGGYSCLCSPPYPVPAAASVAAT